MKGITELEQRGKESLKVWAWKYMKGITLDGARTEFGGGGVYHWLCVVVSTSDFAII